MADPRVILDGERYVLDLVRERLPYPEPIVFDVGANVGDYAREVVERVPQARLFCFEPQPDALAELTVWTQGKRACVVPVALSDEAGPMTLRATDTACCYLAGLYRDHDAPSGLAVDREIKVTATTLDAYCASIGLYRINLLKLDTEGHEPWVLDGARSLLADASIDLIQFEMADVARNAGWTFRGMFNRLQGLGFDLYLEHADRLERLNADAPLDDPEHYVNVLAVARYLNWEG